MARGIRSTVHAFGRRVVQSFLVYLSFVWQLQVGVTFGVQWTPSCVDVVVRAVADVLCLFAVCLLCVCVYSQAAIKRSGEIVSSGGSTIYNTLQLTTGRHCSAALELGQAVLSAFHCYLVTVPVLDYKSCGKHPGSGTISGVAASECYLLPYTCWTTSSCSRHRGASNRALLFQSVRE